MAGWVQVSSETQQYSISVPTSSGTRVANAISVGGVFLVVGQGDPTNVIPAPVGSFFLRTDGGTSTSLYVKETGGSAASGWVAK